jgi:hypothetical protein
MAVVLIGTVDHSGRPSLLPGDVMAAGLPEVADSDGGPRAAAAAELAGWAEDPEPGEVRFVLEHEVHKKIGQGGMVFVPRGFWTPTDGSYDLVVHFHGGAQVVEPLFRDAGLNAVLVTVNLGIGSRVYDRWFSDPHAFETLLAEVDRLVRLQGPSSRARLRRLALSSWSAGYAAVLRILSRARHVAQVDAVLLADGIHAPLADARQRRIADRGMEPFVRFARSAQQGDKLMVLTHSAIPTGPYASTSETAAYLVRSLALPTAQPADAPQDMQVTSSHAAGELRVTGFTGQDARAHCDHLQHIDQTTLAALRDRWSRA